MSSQLDSLSPAGLVDKRSLDTQSRGLGSFLAGMSIKHVKSHLQKHRLQEDVAGAASASAAKEDPDDDKEEGSARARAARWAR